MPVEQDQPQRPPDRPGGGDVGNPGATRPGGDLAIPRGTRGNGLPVAGWAAVADLDPRIADDVLITLHANGIGAYAEPTPAETGGYLQQEQLPVRHTDRLFADLAAQDRARQLVAAELAESVAAEAADRGELLPEPPRDRPGTEPDEDHFRPPPPPPIPRLRPATLCGLALIALGIVILVTGYQGGEFGILGVGAIIAGVGVLVWHMKDGPPTDSGWDDGAVL